MILFILLSPLLLLGAAASGAASGGRIAEALGDRNEYADRWSWFLWALFVAGFTMALVTVFYTLPRFLALVVPVLALSYKGARDLLREVTPW